MEILIIYLDGIVFGAHHVLAAVGVDAGGNKHVLGIAEGANENQVVVQGLLAGWWSGGWIRSVVICS